MNSKPGNEIPKTKSWYPVSEATESDIVVINGLISRGYPMGLACSLYIKLGVGKQLAWQEPFVDRLHMQDHL